VSRPLRGCSTSAFETDAWSVNPGRGMSEAILSTLVEAKVRQLTTDASEIFRLIRSF